MKKVLKFIIATSLVFSMTTMAAFAQVSLNATAGTILDDVDYSKNYMYFKNADVNDYIVSGEISTDNLNVNFGKQFSSVYWDIDYYGNLWGYNNTNKTETKNSTTTTKNSYNYWNNFRTFFGFRNFSIGAGFNFSGYKDSVNASNQKTINPSLFLSGDIDLITMLIKPYFEFDYTKYTDDKYEPNWNKESNLFGLNLGTDLVTDNGDSKSIWTIDYNVEFGKENYTSNISDKVTMLYKPVDNDLTISYKVNKNLGSKLVLSTKVSLLNQFNSVKKYDQNDNEDYSSFTYKLNPTLAFGIKYDLKPSKLSLLLGDTMSIFPVTVVTTENKNTNVKTTETTTETFSSTLTCGLNWNINSNTALDFKSYIPANNMNTLGNMQFAIGLSYRK